MGMYKYKNCVRCQQEFFQDGNSLFRYGDRKLCDTCEMMNRDPNNLDPHYIYKRIDWQSGLEKPKSNPIPHYVSPIPRDVRATIRHVEALPFQDMSQSHFHGSAMGNNSSSWAADHVIPISTGGLNTADNIALACTLCNGSKNDRTPEQWRLSQAMRRVRAVRTS